MIYRVVLDDTIDLHTSDINCMLLNPSLDLEMNSAGSFNFTLPPSHPYWDSIKVLKSTIDVYEDGDLIFTGRIASIEKNWNNERVVQCEGALAYFNDSIHRQMKWETPLPIASEDPTVHNFLKDILDNHNVFEGAENANRHIFIGNITVDPEVVTREVNYDTTLDILTRMCIDTNGGYMSVRKDLNDGKLYLDWIKDFTEESGQPAQFGLNLLNFDTSLAAEDICTGVLARGAEVNEQTVMLNNVELVDETTYPDMSVTHYTDKYQDILWHREGVEKFGQVVQVHDFSDAQTAWKDGQGQIVANSLFEMAKKWLEEKNTKIETIEVEVAELAWLGEGMPKYKLGQIVELSDNVHMAGESYETRLLPMYKLSCDLNSGSKKVTLGTPPKKELTQISASNSDSSTLSSSGSSSGSGGSGEGEECRVHDVRVDGTSVVTNKIANISLAGKADVSTVNALATTVAGKADTSTVNALATVVASKQDQIEFNTLEAATEVLTRLKADNKVYNLGGGTEVEANPSDPATTDLTKLKVGNDIYGIPSGGNTYTAGDYININNDEISVNRNLIPNAITYKIVTKSTGNNDAAMTIQKYENGALVSSTDYVYTNCTGNGVNIDDTFNLSYNRFVSFNWSYLLLVDSKDHSAGYRQDWNYHTSVNYSEVFETEDLSGYKLITKNELEAQVEANPSETATDDLNTIKIGDTVYDIPGGGGSSTNYGKFKSDVLFNTPTTTSAWASPIEICSEEKAKEYDMIYLITKFVDGSSNGFISNSYLVNSIGHSSDNDWMMGIRSNSRWNNPEGFVFLSFDNSKLKFYTNTGNSSTLYKVYGLKFENKLINRSDIYSEEERMIGRWTDGKPLYQKVLTIPNLPNATSANYPHGIQNVDNIWVSDGVAKNTQTGSSCQLNNTASSNTYQWVTNVDRTNVSIWAGTDRRAFDYVKVILKYTKTTDTADSDVLPEDPMFISDPMIYSEEEQVVGSWTDGKPLYQKSGSIVYTANTPDWTLVENLDNYDYLVSSYGTFYEINGTNKDYIPHYGGRTSDPRLCVRKDHKLYHYYNSYPGNNRTMVYDYTIQYTKTTDSILSGPKKGKIVQRSDIYSEEERLIGRWTDGKPLYQKTFTKVFGNSNQQETITTFTNGEDLHYATGYIETLNSNTRTIIPYNNSSNYCLIRQLNNNLVSIRDSAGSWYGYTYKVTIQYTKSTDAPFSKQLIEDPQFVMMSDVYSEDEQVVGRWTDGKPIYQKTWNFGQNLIVSSQSWTETSIKISDYNFDHVVSVVSAENSEKNCSWNFIAANTDTTNSQYIRLWSTRSATINIRYITLQYTKTTDAPGTGPTKGNLIYLPALYSEEEREVGVWTDGKPLYQKMIPIPAIQSAQSGVLISNLGLNIDKCVDIKVRLYKDTGVDNDTVIATASFGDMYFYYRKSEDSIRMDAPFSWVVGRYGSATIQYTKTTDQPGSATWTPEGQLAHHYSTSEKIVGTWIDGSAVYERTWSGLSYSTSNNWTNFVTIPNGKNLIKVNFYGEFGTDLYEINAQESHIDSSTGILEAWFQLGSIRTIKVITLQYTKSS